MVSALRQDDAEEAAGRVGAVRAGDSRRGKARQPEVRAVRRRRRETARKADYNGAARAGRARERPQAAAPRRVPPAGGGRRRHDLNTSEEEELDDGDCAQRRRAQPHRARRARREDGARGASGLSRGAPSATWSTLRRRKNVRSKFVWRRGNAPRVFFVLLALLVLATRRARHDARAQKMSGGFNSPRASATPTDLAAMATRRGDTALRARERERDLPAFPTDISRASKNEGAKQYADWRFLFKSRSVKTGTEYLANPECVASYDRMISLIRSIPPGTPAADGDPTALLTHEGVVQAEDNQHLYTDIKNAITQRKNVSDIDRTCMTLLRRHENDGVALLKALDEAFAPGTDKTSQSAALEKFAKLRQDAKFTAFIEGLEDARADVISTGCTLPDELVRNKLWAGVRDGPRVLALKAAIETSSEYAGATYDSLRKLLEPAALADEAHEDDDAGTTATFVSCADNGGGGRGARQRDAARDVRSTPRWAKIRGPASTAARKTTCGVTSSAPPRARSDGRSRPRSAGTGERAPTPASHSPRAHGR